MPSTSKVVPQLAQPGMRVEEAVVPEGAGPGSTVAVQLSNGSQVEVEVPEGFSAGETFRFQVPEDPQPVAVAQPVVQATQPIAPVTAQPVISGVPVQGQLLSNGSAPSIGVFGEGMAPLGAPPGGWMIHENYCGSRSCFFACILVLCNLAPAALCVPCCPCDERDVYVSPDGRCAALAPTSTPAPLT